MTPGIYLVNKPAGMTSHDVVNRIRRITGERRVGHAGTLDPFATGVLVVGVGREATKTLGWLTEKTEKRYRATIRLGATSETDDRDGAIVEREDVAPLTKSAVQHALQAFRGTIKQIPPRYSSIKTGGVHAYQRARKGQPVPLAPRSVTVHSISVLHYRWPELVIEVTCSSGTYIRAIARDLGDALGCGGYLDALERTAVGLYTLQKAHTLGEIEHEPASFLLPIPKRTP